MHITFSVAPVKMKIYFGIYWLIQSIYILKGQYFSNHYQTLLWKLKFKEWVGTRIWSFSYENYAIRILTFYSVKACLQFFLNPSMRISSQKSCLIFTYCNVKIQPLPFKSPAFSEILVSKKIAEIFLLRRLWGVRIGIFVVQVFFLL